MKKLMTILVVFAMCGVAMAVTGTSSATAQFPLKNGEDLDYINFKTETELGSSGLKYTVTDSIRKDSDGHRMGHVYFTTMSQEDLNAFNAANKTNVKKVAVQFVGAQEEYSGARNDKNWTVTDYGIYLDQEDGTRKYMSYNEYNNYFELNPGQDFGVYYKGTENQVVGGHWEGRGWNAHWVDEYEEKEILVTSEEGYIGNYDTGREIHDENFGKNKITVYKEGVVDENGKLIPVQDWTYKKFMCLFQDTYADPIHWEFMLQTRLDDPAVDVRPDDVNEVLPSASGQPLPGTLATLLIGGLCAGSLRKRNKK